ncbi:serine/threonine-protein kinase [Nocardia bhagyanarayanae]|uniref:non-specific serine/threonine protein kinase n=1 Tax=Nocardia bhagyanarayanae TaxID=1215925 RepID=A0A543FEE7_9NOCA|nr:serine/threonine-protein kinase [Nocardia bhagyanarayanae]TQM32250.1 serine/threonine-protein kinase [Nocardia bhagyanarayanae]
MNVVEGTTFAGYRIERRLGSGGMGTVYAAAHPRLPRTDALKVLSDARADDPEFRARFLREAELAARLQHPNLVAVRDRGEHEGRLWIAMQYVEGVDLTELIRRGPAVLDPARAVRILAQAAQGLDEIHRAGLLHRDVKPANILVAERPDGPDRVLVTDFGIARGADDAATLTGSGSFAATLAYAAPEQLGGGAVDRRADVYALGCTLYQMLTGSVPFPRHSPGSVLYAHLHEPAPRPSLRNPRLPKAFDDVIANAMAKLPDDRYDSCGELAAAARSALSTPAGSSRRRNRRAALVAAAALAVLAVGVPAVWFGTGGDGAASTANDDHRPVAASVEPAQWGAYAYIAQTFPELLPSWPFGAGYQDVSTCAPLDERGENRSLDASVPVARLFCLGDGDPVESVQVTCNADRSPIGPSRSFARVEGDEHWSRPSGTGHIFWGSELYSGTGTFLDGQTWGVLEVYFDDPSRNFCKLRVVGAGPSGAGLRDRWWSDAPL